MDYLYNICWLLLAQAQVAQPEAAEAAAKAVEGGAPANQGPFGNMMLMLPIFMAVFLLYMVMTAKPQQKGQPKNAELLANLKKNDQVVTAGGILGTVVNYRSDSEYVTLRVDDSSNTRIQVLATSIFRVINEEDSKA